LEADPPPCLVDLTIDPDNPLVWTVTARVPVWYRVRGALRPNPYVGLLIRCRVDASEGYPMAPPHVTVAGDHVVLFHPLVSLAGPAGPPAGPPAGVPLPARMPDRWNPASMITHVLRVCCGVWLADGDAWLAAAAKVAVHADAPALPGSRTAADALLGELSWRGMVKAAGGDRWGGQGIPLEASRIEPVDGSALPSACAPAPIPAPPATAESLAAVVAVAAAPTSGAMALAVVSLTSKVVRIELPHTATLADLKARFQDREGLPPDQQLVLHGAWALREDGTLADQGVTNGSTLHLVLPDVVVAGGLNRVALALLRGDVEAFEWAAWRSARLLGGWGRRRVAVVAAAAGM
jgi:hypothetical protein